MKDQMFRYLQRFGILLFFCTCMGAIIMADCTMAIGITERDRGLAASFSENTMQFSLMQADTPDSWTNGDLLDFLNTTGKSGIPVRLLKKTSTGAGELYTTEEDFFPGEDREGYGVLVRTDQKTVLTENDQIYYQGNSYPVVGEYTSELTPENCLIDMKGVLSDRSEYAMEGIFYLDCGSSTAAVYAALSGAGTAKYPAAQFTVLEESARGNLRKRLGESPDAVYYLLTMALLAMLNLLNFGNVAGYWVSERRKEIYARRLCGGARRSVATKLTLEFSLTAGILIAAGTAIGALFAAQAVRISGKAIILGFGIDALQWAIFVLFGAVLLRKECRSTIPELARPLH